MVAAIVVLTGCASADEDEQATTSPVVTETSANPWDLPIEQRPALFDPCEEIPIEAVEQGVGGPVEADDYLYSHRPGDLFSCGWRNDEVILNIVGTWRARQELIADPTFIDVKPQTVAGRIGLRARDRSNESGTCYQIYFTSQGAVFSSVDLIDSLNSFRGSQFADACDVVGEAIGSVVDYLPKGDF